MTNRIATAAVAALIVGLALHNAAMAALWRAGLRDGPLTVVSAWKEALHLLALGVVAWRTLRERRLPFTPNVVDALAAAFALLALLYAVLPQGWLEGQADNRAIAYGLRSALVPVGAWFLGRSVPLPLERLRALAIGVAAAVAAIGLVDLYAVSLDWWRHSGTIGWYRDQLDLDYGKALSGLPENFVYNDGDERPERRLVSTFLSPLATSHLLVVALLGLTAARRGRWTAPLAALLLAGLLFTYSRSALAALAGGLVVLALARRRLWPAAAAVVLVVLGIAFVKAYPSVGPETTFTPAELAYQRENAAKSPVRSGDPLDPGEASTASHWRSLRDGIDTVIQHPQGFGLGNAGTSARRTGDEPKAGESTYTELGVETGLLGMLAFIGWGLGALWLLVRREPWLAAAFAAVLAIALQTDVLGVPWLAYCLWALAGTAASRPPLSSRTR